MKRLLISCLLALLATPAFAACIPSGVTDQYIYFVAVDSTDFTTRETGLTTFTVYRSRDGAAAAAMTTPTVNETDTTNMPGVYELLLDEDMTIGASNIYEEMAFHITQASMAPVTRTIQLCQTDGSGQTAQPWNSAWDAEAQSEANDAILANFTFTSGSVDADVEYWNGTIVSTALETSADIADAVRTEPCGTETADTFGDLICNDVEGLRTDVTTARAGYLDNINGHTAQTGDSFAGLEQHRLLDTTLMNCEVNTLNFAGSTTTVACILTDRDDVAVTQASNDLEGLQIVVTSGAQIREARFITDSTWDGVNSELQLTLSRALPATLADAVTAIIR